jgi:hypothetical protein
MQQDHHIFFNCKNGTGNASINRRSHLPQARFELSNQWHPNRPAILSCFNVAPNRFAITTTQIKQPLSQPALSLIENGKKQLGGQGEFPFREQPVSITVPEMVRPGLASSPLTGSSGHPNKIIDISFEVGWDTEIIHRNAV